MSSKVINSTMVKPAQETPKRRLWLSNLDVAAILKDSLARVLVPFYPIAGRLAWDTNGRLEVDCNGEGVLFVEAENQRCLSEFGDFEPTPENMRLVIPPCDYSVELKLIPLLTRFRCGGVTLGFAQHHTVADGSAYLHLINSWARMARGELEIELPPFHEREPYLVPRNPPQVTFPHPEFDPPRGLPADVTDTTVSIFRITPDQLSTLKQKGASDLPNSKLSTYDILAAHVLRSACMARQLPPDQHVRLYVHADARHRLAALPCGFFGNAIIKPVHVARAGDVMSNPLGHVAGEIRRTLAALTAEEYVRSVIDHLEVNHEAAARGFGGQNMRAPDMLVSSWLKFPFYEADYGWGRPRFAGRGGCGSEGFGYLVGGPEEKDGLFLVINLLKKHVEFFRKCLYEF